MRETVEAIGEAELIAGIQRGDPESLREAFSRYGPAVYRIGLRLTGSRAEADDVLQDVFIGLPEALRGTRIRVGLEPWLKKVAVRVALMRLRRERNRRQEPLVEREARGRIVGDAVDRVALERAIAALPETMRSVFVLREIEGYSHTEVADLLGIETGTSEVRLHRAKQKLRQILRSE